MFKNLQLLFSPMSKSQRKLLKELQDYNVLWEAQKYYKHNIKNNLNDTYKIIKSKLIRNIVLGKKIWDGYYCKKYQYGNLEIYVDTKDKEVYKLRNNKGLYKYDVDEEVKEWLNDFLGIGGKKN